MPCDVRPHSSHLSLWSAICSDPPLCSWANYGTSVSLWSLKKTYILAVHHSLYLFSPVHNFKTKDLSHWLASSVPKIWSLFCAITKNQQLSKVIWLLWANRKLSGTVCTCNWSCCLRDCGGNGSSGFLWKKESQLKKRKINFTMKKKILQPHRTVFLLSSSSCSMWPNIQF